MMKTFKMLSFAITQKNGHIQNIPILDGILINKEDPNQTWLIEVYLKNEFREIFNQAKESNELLEIQAIISFPDNEPAPFTARVLDILSLNNQVSVLMEGKVNVLRPKYAEKLLKNLLKQDLSKNELLEKFKKGMKERPPLKS